MNGLSYESLNFNYAPNIACLSVHSFLTPVIIIFLGHSASFLNSTIISSAVGLL